MFATMGVMDRANVSGVFRSWAGAIAEAEKAVRGVHSAIRGLLAEVIGPEGEENGYWVHFSGEGDSLSELVLFGFGPRRPLPWNRTLPAGDELARGYVYSARAILAGLAEAANRSARSALASQNEIYHAAGFSPAEDISLSLGEFLRLARILYPEYQVFGETGVCFFWAAFARAVLPANGITDWQVEVRVKGGEPMFHFVPLSPLNGVPNTRRRASRLLREALVLFGRGRGKCVLL